MTDTNANNDQNIADEVINHEQFIDMRDLLEDDFAELIQSYTTDSEQRIVALRTALANNDNANGFEAAHSLKGASATLGATQLEVLCGELQDRCRQQNIGAQATVIEKISIALQDVEQEINHRLDL